MTTPTTPAQARELADDFENIDHWHLTGVKLQHGAEILRSLAQQVEKLTAEVLLKAEYCRTTSNAHEAACAERDALRAIIVDSVAALGAAASVSQTSSIEFLQDVPGEIRKTVGALKADGGRYQKIRAGTRVQRGSCFEQIWFVLPEVKPIPGVNIQNGNVAQHLDAAIDAAMKAES